MTDPLWFELKNSLFRELKAKVKGFLTIRVYEYNVFVEIKRPDFVYTQEINVPNGVSQEMSTTSGTSIKIANDIIDGYKDFIMKKYFVYEGNRSYRERGNRR